ncbi:MAG: hypothetical protein ACREXS_09330, partial [Gammaproteobacteria bacterium]
YGNGIPLTRAFDRDDRLTAQTAGIVQDLGFHFDPNGNITGITNPLDPGRNQAFGYDALDRLTEAEGRYGDLGYTYDPAGNRSSRIRNGFSEDSDSHQLLQSPEGGTRGYRYDPNGNTTDNTDYGFVYGDHGRLTAVTQAGVPLATYTYNGRGERVRKIVGEDRPDYTALAAEQEALAAAHRSEAERMGPRRGTWRPAHKRRKPRRPGSRARPTPCARRRPFIAQTRRDWTAKRYCGNTLPRRGERSRNAFGPGS